LLAATFPIHGKELYFTLFGQAGYHESQVIMPHARYGDYLAYLREQVHRAKMAITLGVAKPFAGTNELLHFDGKGISLAIQLPRCRGSAEFLAELDKFVVDAGGRSNAIKDSRLPRAVFEAGYPECDRFRTIRREWDRRGWFRSELSRRLGL